MVIIIIIIVIIIIYNNTFSLELVCGSEEHIFHGILNITVSLKWI